MRLDLDRVRSAVDHIDPVFLGTPQYVNEPLSDLLGCRLVLKVETLNPVRSFKGRGTETVFARLDSSQRERGVVCASAGNLGQALAYGARSRGVTAVVAVSAAASPMKIERMRALGADVRLVDGEIEAALARASLIGVAGARGDGTQRPFVLVGHVRVDQDERRDHGTRVEPIDHRLTLAACTVVTWTMGASAKCAAGSAHAASRT